MFIFLDALSMVHGAMLNSVLVGYVIVSIHYEDYSIILLFFSLQ